MFGKPKEQGASPSDLCKAGDLLRQRIDSLNVRAEALNTMAQQLGNEVRRRHADDPNDVQIKHLFQEYKATQKQCADVSAMRAALTRKLYALDTHVLAKENIAALTSVQRTLGATVAPGLLDTVDDALDAITADVDAASEISDALTESYVTDDGGLAEFLDVKASIAVDSLPVLPEAPSESPRLVASPPSEAITWLQ